MEAEIPLDDFPDMVESMFRPPSAAIGLAADGAPKAEPRPTTALAPTKRAREITSTSGWAVVVPDGTEQTAISATADPNIESIPENKSNVGLQGPDEIRLKPEPDPQAGISPHLPSRNETMANNINQILAQLQEIDGFIAAAVADSASGLTLGKAGGNPAFNVELAAAANTEVVKAKLRAMKSLKLEDSIEDILITLSTQYHLIRPLRSRPEIFFYVSLDRKHANLAMARFSLADAEAKLTI